MKLPGDSVVPSKISGVEPKPVRVASGAAVNKRLEQSAGKAGSSAVAEADVQLTGAARNLAALEQSLRELPAVDEVRVALVKQRLDNGTYQVDPQRVADKLLRMEQELDRGNPGNPLDKNPLR
jgi:negative regulator of flagellin synthesis FlgM